MRSRRRGKSAKPRYIQEKSINIYVSCIFRPGKGLSLTILRVTTIRRASDRVGTSALGMGCPTDDCRKKYKEGTNLSPMLLLPVNEKISGNRGLVNQQMGWDRSHPMRLLLVAEQDRSLGPGWLACVTSTHPHLGSLSVVVVIVD